MEITIGIDLGTTNTVVCYPKNGHPTPIKFKGSGNMLPSIIYVDEDGSVLVGNAARAAYYSDEPNGVKSSKTFMGDASQKWICRGREFTPTDVATEILKYVRQEVIRKFKGDENTVINAVITFPAEFKSTQIDETKKAGEAAGLNVIRTVSEPIAAAFAAATDMETTGKIMVVDFGGGTFDLALLESDKRKYNVVVHGGDRQLGGDRFDIVIENYLLNRVSEETGKDLSSYEKSGIPYNLYWSMRGRLHSAAISAKESLSNATEADINLSNLLPLDGGMYNLDIQLTRKKFDELCKDIYAEVFKYIDEFVDKGKIRAEDLSEIILAGDSCYIPYIRKEIERRFNKQPNMELDPSTLFAYGACIVAEYEMYWRDRENYNALYQEKIAPFEQTQKIFDEMIEYLARQRQELEQRRADLENDYQQKNKMLDAEYWQKNNDWQIQKNAEQQDLERQRAEVEREKQTTLQIQQDAQNAKDAADEIYANHKAKIDSYDNLYQEKIDAQNNFEAEKSRADFLQGELYAAILKIQELQAQIGTLGKGN